MEAEATSQIALDSYTRASPPFLGHQFFPGGSFGDNMSGGRHSSYTPRVVGGSTSANRSSEGTENGRYNNGHRMEWNAKAWDWDSILFLAQPSGTHAGSTRGSHQNGNVDHRYTHPNGIDFRLARDAGNADRNGSSDLEDTHTARRGKDLVRNQEKEHASDSGGRTQTFLRDGSSPEEDPESLSLKLGVVHSYAGSDDGGSGSRDAKRYRSSSPGSQLPMCQVDGCKTDLSRAKDYHQRHKVCEAHAKATKALVSRLMQRFCQQCSRFHPLAEFDEGKRSCRRRLAGHNRRRRKNQPEPPSGRGLLGLDETGSGPGLVGILNVLSSLQAANQPGAQSGIGNDRDALLQYLKALMQPAAGSREGLTAAALANLLGRNGNIPEVRQPENKIPSFTGQTQTAEAELLEALAGPRSPEEALALLLQSTWRSAILKAAESPLVQVAQNNGNSAFPMATPNTRMPSEMPPHSVGGGPVLSLSSAPPARPVHVSNGVSSSRRGISRNHTAPKQHSRQRSEHLQAEILQPPSRPVAVAQTLFPVSQAGQCANNGQYSVNVEDGSSSDPDAPSTIPYSHTNDSPEGPSRYDLNESSPSGSDQSPSSSSADWQDRIGRISIKLFDRNPGELPLTLRSQILEWLAHRPSDMESYIRPGCTVVTVFLSMPKSSWSELDRTLRSGLQRLVDGREFWMRGRIHMQVDRRNAFIHDGKVQILRPLRTTAIPQLLSVRPLAVVMGQRTNIVLKGRNLNQPETRVYCAYNGKYMLQNVSDGERQGSQGLTVATENESGWEELSICFDGGISDVVGRAFIEVERQTSGGDSLPVIVADGPVCKELESLENACAHVSDSEENERHDDGADGLARRINAKDFVSELGWLFQKSQASHKAATAYNLHPARQRELLCFAVERDWCAVVEKMLDILFDYVKAFPENMAKLVEVLADNGEGNLLHTAVQNRRLRVVKLLLSYTPFRGAGSADSEAVINAFCKSRSQTRFIFTPEMKNREGLTPLHIAATMDGAEELINALTNDPNQIGVHTWVNVCNAKGDSPQVSALSCSNASYVQLVIRKTTGHLDGAVAIDVRPEKTVPRSGEKTRSSVGTLELATWLTEASRVLGEDEGRKSLVLARSCRHVPPTLRGFRGATLYRPFLLSMMTVAAVCVCACIIMRGSPEVLCTRTFSWKMVKSGFQ